MSAGFSVDSHGLVHIGEVTVRLLGRQGNAEGIVGWGFSGLSPGVTHVHGIPVTSLPAVGAPQAEVQHPNGVCAVDHIVVLSDDWERGIRDFRTIGLEPLRQTNTVRKGVTQVIYRPSKTIIELVGGKIAPEEPTLWGLTLVSKDVDATHVFLSASTKKPWPAVQPGLTLTPTRTPSLALSVTARATVTVTVMVLVTVNVTVTASNCNCNCKRKCNCNCKRNCIHHCHQSHSAYSSLFLSLCLSISLSLHLSVPLSLCLSVPLSL